MTILKAIEKLIQKWSINCIIFDLDGTLVDTLDLHIKAFELLFEELGLTIKYSAIADNMGRTPKDTLRSLLPLDMREEQIINQYAERKEQLLAQLLEKDSITIFPGAKELLSLIDRQDMPICLASSTPKYNVLKILHNIQFVKYFDCIITGEDIEIGKPNPQIFLKAATKANSLPEECLVIGDSVHDIEAAKKAKMKVIVVTTGKHTNKQLTNLLPDKIIKNLAQLL